ncbi:4-hydroxy-tetrahydrodipicolinate synthase [Variovorax sp. N23]|uniref:4-hydroxy-tetrahydrodipicolinate synthase n=1 Tax=Variovorax sp. N23 TaxID=2980555 RepID=UPI0021C660CB|nr:4-hydroxy-tetrahydrodipicolinate synthase [Variovorax sp. N23]MCU4121785.1 4-hydroxy-tetrahydrodipicolinate synthase [Variovorax sp. N23]
MSRLSTPSPQQPDFSGLWIPLITPFRDHAVDYPALDALVRHLAPTGIVGFVVCGSTGEAAALEEAEQLAVLATVADAAPDVPRIMGISGSHLEKTLAWVRRLTAEPLAGLLVPAPSYIRPTQEGLLLWFRAIAEASSLPILIYDIPYRTGATMSTETLLALAAHPKIRAVKDCGGDPSKTHALIVDRRLQVLAGEDAQIFATLAEGGAGAIAASAHLHTAHFVRLLHLLTEGRFADAREIWRSLRPLIALCFAEPNPAPVKAMLARGGALHDELRAPMTPASVALRERLRVAVELLD